MNKGKTNLRAGKDFVGVGVGAVIFNSDGKFLLIRRGKKAKNEIGVWGIPGGAVDYGETFEQAIKREVQEELGIGIKPLKILSPVDHIIKKEKQHWVTTAFISQLTKGSPQIIESGKIDKIEWKTLDEIKKVKKMSFPAKHAFEELQERYAEFEDFF